ncbi:hypothetical protein ACQ42_gp47 [Vibrio phage J2]|uniref:Uncharacterized protein n=1 Tax=Vibrio phage J2 TaxID=1558467 RepID=A0A0A7HAQ1_9CAUD|nr:hypothetical protein ACQ42_gp47 [Vibrio phage J2]AIZ01542.1 hypothetical protein H2_0047 [Vibrio phage H2 SGB-2014]AIZ01638.1 hypothetical protein J2_0047 [Vibrio phage J2]
MGAKWGRRPMPRGRTRIFRQSLWLESKTLSRMRNVQRVPMSTVRRYRFFPAFSTSRRYLQILIFLEVDTVDTVDTRPSDGGSRPVQLLAACPPCPVQYGGSVHRVHRVHRRRYRSAVQRLSSGVCRVQRIADGTLHRTVSESAFPHARVARLARVLDRHPKVC